MKLESKPVANMLLYVVSIAISLLLMYLARDFSTGGSNVCADSRWVSVERCRNSWDRLNSQGGQTVAFIISAIL